MKDRPMLFGAPMVCALLDGRKSQTRRLLRNPEYYGCPTGDCPHEYQAECDAAMAGLSSKETGFEPGDRLWVKETWKPGSWRDDGRVAVDYRASPELVRTPWCAPENFDELWPKWTDELTAIGSVPDEAGIHHWEAGKSPLKWRSSMFMPRWASRLTLTVTDVRVERLQDISEADAIAEGVTRIGAEYGAGIKPTSFDDGPNFYTVATWYGSLNAPTAVEAYAYLWNAINGPGAWEANPWVTAITFTVAHSNIDQVPA